jgi:mono/diheme cytochrome c family protein
MNRILVGLLAASLTVLAQAPGERPEREHLIASLDGQALFMNYCAACHGKAANGRGPMAQVLKVPVPDLTEISKRNGGKFPFDKVQKRIVGEDSDTPVHGTKEMPIWGPIFSQVTTDQDFGKVRVYNLTKYLQTLQK